MPLTTMVAPAPKPGSRKTREIVAIVILIEDRQPLEQALVDRDCVQVVRRVWPPTSLAPVADGNFPESGLVRLEHELLRGPGEARADPHPGRTLF